jgi:hypothetical protein
LNNIKKSAVSRGENIRKKTGQKSCKYGEIIKKPYFFVWGKARPKPPHTRESTEFTRGKSADAGRGRQIHTRNWDTERGGGGENNAKLHETTFGRQILHEDSYYLLCRGGYFLLPHRE